MDGTRTYLVGTGRVAVVDPGPDISQHLDDIVAGLEGAEAVTVL
ncbi:MAG: MBL fold metallo-hydrolase, partial [Gemmatimonadetes bacterium]|nr:MBL fold metallo-hydrolase [Gemmatimonadota bacterium]